MPRDRCDFNSGCDVAMARATPAAVASPGRGLVTPVQHFVAPATVPAPAPALAPFAACLLLRLSCRVVAVVAAAVLYNK